VLKVLEIFTTRGNVGCVFEYGGDGIATLTVPERATITNMGAECGVTTSLFPSDGVTRQFLRAEGRERDWVQVKADDDAEYDRVVDIDLGSIVPLAAYPHSPGNIKTVRELEGLQVDQVCMGSCTNSSYVDMMTVARILENQKVHPAVGLVVAPGSRQVLQNISRDGGLATLLSAGARIAETACGFCIGNSQSPRTDSISIRTSNRNFLGRSGTKSAQVYLTSPETAAAAVITGKLTDPRDLEAAGIAFPGIQMPDRFFIDDSMFLYPSEDPGQVEIYRGPNIGDPPTSTPMPEAIHGVVTIKVGDKVTTDHIIPAGDKMKYRSNVPKYSEFLFEVIDPTFYERAKVIRDSGRHNIIVAGMSYGQGSSREHAALCPMYMGVRVVLAKSLERIHTDNLINFGIVPLTFKDEADYGSIDPGDEIEISGIRQTLEARGAVLVHNKTRGIEFEVCYNLSDRQRETILAGGTLALMAGRQ
jgi:aconitate hydratase